MTEKMNTWSGTHRLASLSFVHMIGRKIIPILKALLQGKFFIFKILFLVVFLRFSAVVFLLGFDAEHLCKNKYQYISHYKEKVNTTSR